MKFHHFSVEDLLQGLLAASPNPIIVADLEGRILIFSAAAESLLGYSASDTRRNLLARDLFSDPLLVPEILQTLRDAAEPPAPRRVRLRAQDGQTFPARLWIHPLSDSEERISAWLGIMEDNRESSDLEARLNQTVERLVASEKRATTVEVAGAAAHNLNQPLTSIMGNIELLISRRDLPPTIKPRIQQIYDQLERMAQAIHELSQVQKYQTTPYVGEGRILDIRNKK